LAASSGVRITGIPKLTGTLDRLGGLAREGVRGFLVFIVRCPFGSRQGDAAEERERTEKAVN
jgi:hypothetical protein